MLFSSLLITTIDFILSTCLTSKTWNGVNWGKENGAKMCWNKDVSQVTYWVLTITMYQNNQLDMLNNLFKCAGSIIKVQFLEILIEQVQEQRNLFEA